MVGIFCGYGSGVGIELGLQWKFPTASVAYASQHQWVKNNVSMRVCVLSFQIQNRQAIKKLILSQKILFCRI